MYSKILKKNQIDQLLFASSLCGLKPNQTIHRLQLFFVVNKDLGSKSHQMALQRALENGVASRYWNNWTTNTSIKNGEYELTQKGYNRAIYLFGSVESIYSPVTKDGCYFTLEGYVDGIDIYIEIRKARTYPYLDGIKYRCIDACDILGIAASPSLAGAALYDFAIDNKFSIEAGY